MTAAGRGRLRRLKDRYGLSWQTVPERLDELIEDPARAAAAASV